ncbi:hypothetical protein EZJ49_13465 [Bdellovibrio bacteriovorus]|uniref:hypothetical protein n=1 Tax=Bdellovibrio bacteriovorus TaxID=959 RepID=UPI0021D1CF14|nr:hypothetical protein [Bdellovibrio bacteriovorus]UXR64071.1 hypothetical protein EZJ49_13465 [Bdellovibrio bacteriovorus]
MENPFSKITNAANQGLKARYGDPFVATYTLSFLAWNYQIILYLLSDYEATNKHSLIKHSLTVESFVAPAFLTIFVLLILPKALLKAHELYENNRTDLKNIQFKAEEKLKPTADQIAYLWNQQTELNNKVISLQNTITAKDQEIGGLKSKLNDITSLRKEQEKTIKLLTSEQANKHNQLSTLLAENRSMKETLDQIQASQHARNLQNIDPEIENAMAFLKKADLTKSFMRIAEALTIEPKPINKYKSELIVKLKTQGLIQTTYLGTQQHIKLTTLGNIVLKYMVAESADSPATEEN